MTKTFTQNENNAILNQDLLRLTRETELEYLDMKIYLDRLSFEPSKEVLKRIMDFSKSLN